MNSEDSTTISNLTADISKCVNNAKSDWVMNGFSDADWEQYKKDLEGYGLSEYLSIFQKYLDAYFES